MNGRMNDQIMNESSVIIFEQEYLVRVEKNCQVDMEDQLPIFRHMLRTIPKFDYEWINSKQRQDYFKSPMMNADNVRFVYSKLSVLFLMPAWFKTKYQKLFKIKGMV